MLTWITKYIKNNPVVRENIRISSLQGCNGGVPTDIFSDIIGGTEGVQLKLWAIVIHINNNYCNLRLRTKSC